MRLSSLSNDIYKLLKYLKNLEVDYKDKRVIFDSQKEIAKGIKYSLTKTNSLINDLEIQGLIEKYSGRGKYCITDLGNKVIVEMEKDIKCGGSYEEKI